MSANKYKKRVQIEERVKTQDGQGAFTATWRPIPSGYSFAQVRPSGSFDKFDAGYISNTTSHLVRLRYMPGVKPDQRLVFDGRVLMIQGVYNEDEATKELVLTCEELPISATGGFTPVDQSEVEEIAS